MKDFTHLHVHTEYSLLDGASRVGDLVGRAAALGMDALAITDHGAMYGVIDFYKAAKQAGIKPLIGCEVYVAPGSRREKASEAREYAHLVLLCKNETGYKNLMKLTSEAFLTGFYYKPRIDYDLLRSHAEGLIALSGCLAGEVQCYLMQNNYKQAKQAALKLKGIFGADFYIELQDHGLTEQRRILPLQKKLCEETGIKPVATNDVHYTNRADADAQDILMCIQTNRLVTDTRRMSFQTKEFYLKDGDEMAALFSDIPEALANTREIANKCDLNFKFGEYHLPKFDVPDGETNCSYLEKVARAGLRSRYGNITKEIDDRFNYELSTIKNMGFTDYFLIVWDFVRFARESGIPVGPGRGSAAGSIAAYALGITDIDPLKYSLLFERFLNPERISMPDIDIDFCYERRDEVINYVTRKYGADKVTQILTFGTLGARQVIRDVARTLAISVGEADKIAKMVPSELKITIDKALEKNAALMREYQGSDVIRRLIDVSRALEGLPRHTSTHAAGVVISKDPVTDHVPLQVNVKDGSVTTQYQMKELEQLGLLKMDFLGLRTLTVIRDTIALVKKHRNIDIDIDSLATDDSSVFSMISAGDVDGVFQLESGGMRRLMQELKPRDLGDVMVGISLFRPGPMESIPEYIKNKHNPAGVKYAHPILKPILEETYGCMVYQEQIMRIVRDVAGYSMARSDLVRRAMSKKQHDILEKERRAFVYGDDALDVPGAVKRGVSERVAQDLFDRMMAFANYAFNKSHACAYAVVAYQTAYLRRYFPTEFMCALLNSFIGNKTKLTEYVQSLRKQGITLLPPDFNKSQMRFTIENGAIRYGFSAIANVGDAIKEAVNRRVPVYEDFFDFLSRNADVLNKKRLACLILSGCFDSTGAKRSQLAMIGDGAMAEASARAKRKATGQISMFDTARAEFSPVMGKLPDVPEYDRDKLLAFEKEMTGLYISGHPLDKYAGELKRSADTITDIVSYTGDVEGAPTADNIDGKEVKLLGIISEVTPIKTKKGEDMARVVLEDMATAIGLIVFPKLFFKAKNLLKANEIITVSGRVSITPSGDAEILAEDIISAVKTEQLYVRLSDESQKQELKEVALRFPGDESIVVKVADSGQAYRLAGNYCVRYSDYLTGELKRLFGAENVVFK